MRRFLETPEGRGTALMVNEFGSEGIDDALLRESSDEVTLLGNGCLCCNTRTDLQIALRRLVADRDRGKIPHFGRVLIETSGLADISPILQTFSTDRALGGEFAIEVVLDRGRRGVRAEESRQGAGGAQAGDPGRPHRDLEDRPRRQQDGQEADRAS